MKRLKDLNLVKGVVVIMISILPFLVCGQDTAAQFSELFEEIALQDAGLDAEQLAKIERLEQNPMNRNVYLVNVGDLKTTQENGVLPLRIPRMQESLEVHATQVKLISETDYSWSGEFQNQYEGNVLIISKNGAVFGQINMEEKIYSLRDIGNGKNVIIEIDETKIGPNECVVLEEPVLTQENTTDNKENSDFDAKTHCNANVRILVLFTDAAALVGDPENDAELFVQQTVQACRNSGIIHHDLSFELAGVEELAGFDEGTASIEEDVRDLRMDSIALNLRERFEADIVILLTDGNYREAFGAAFLGDGQNDNLAWGIVEIDAAGGRFTFAHEVAHLFGASHDTDPTPGFAHAHNFITRSWLLGKKTRRRTILNDLTAGDSRIQHFSNPDVEFLNRPTGVENERDNVRQMLNTACDVAAHRDFTAPMSVMIKGTILMVKGTVGNWCADVEGCENVSDYNWSWSEDGFTYFNLGTDACFSMNSFPTNNGYVFLRVIANCADGQTATGFSRIRIESEDGPNFERENTRGGKLVSTQETVSVISFPNPSNESIHFQLKLEKSSEVDLFMMDMMGKRIKTIVSAELEKGIHYFHETTESYQNGLYFLHLETKHGIKTNRIIIQKK